MLITQRKPIKAVGVELENASFDRRSGVSWVYPDSKHASSINHPKNPPFNDSPSFHIRSRDDPDLFDRGAGGFKGREQEVAEELNVDLLVGAKAAEDTLRQYEIDVGICCVNSDSIVHTSYQSLCRAITDDEVALGRERWAELVKNLAGEPVSTRSCSLGSNGREDLRSPTSSEFVSDLTDSEQSVDSDPLPSTPKPKKSYPHVTVKQPSPSLPDLSSSTSLSASASSFIPTPTTPVKSCPLHIPSWPFSPTAPSPTPSPTYTNFSFPSLNSSIQSLPTLPPNLTKDEQGFYTEVSSTPSTVQGSSSGRATQKPSNSVLPSFLADPSDRARKTSKTREIIDQLRSASANDFDRPHSRGTLPTRPLSTPHQLKPDGPFSSFSATADVQSPTMSFQSVMEDFEEEGDGWIRAGMGEGECDSDAKARRTRELVQALGRNRIESSESDPNQGLADWEIIGEPSDSSKRSPKDNSGSSTRRKGARHRSRKSHARNHISISSLSVPASAPPKSLGLSPLPPTHPIFQVPAYPAYTTPYPYTPAYKATQMPTQPYCFPVLAPYPPTFFGPIMYPPGTQIPPTPSVVGVQGSYDRGSITGVSGMRHSQW